MGQRPHDSRLLGALLLLAGAAIVLVACDETGAISVTNETESSWVVIDLRDGELPFPGEGTVAIGPGETGFLQQGIGFDARGDVVLLMTMDCEIADSLAVSTKSVALTIRVVNFHYTELVEVPSAEVPRASSILNDDRRCLTLINRLGPQDTLPPELVPSKAAQTP